MNYDAHTPGLWDFKVPPSGATDFDSARLWVYSDGLLVARVADQPNRYANARLIAAAPELLASLQWALGAMMEPIHEHSQYGQEHEAALAAIAKVKGE